MQRINPATVLKQLESLKTRYEKPASEKKLEFLRVLEHRRLQKADQVLRLHGILCFQRAYPDNMEILDQVENMLMKFSTRGDLRRHGRALVNSGIAGTMIKYRFFWPMARWLAKEFPHNLYIDWDEIEDVDKLMEILPLLVPASERNQFDDYECTPREWLERLKGKDETDAVFLMRRLDSLYSNTYEREAFHDRLDFDFKIEPGKNTPSSTAAKYPHTPVVMQDKPLQRQRTDLRKEIFIQPRSVKILQRRAAAGILSLARKAMVVNNRDLDAFSYGDSNDIRLIDYGDGYQFACIGMLPGRRYLLPSVYGFLNLKNGVPVGYFQTSTLNRMTEVSFNTFATYRGAEAAVIFARALSMAYHLFDINTFSLDNYQLGLGNKEGLESGVWWFYYKLGFRPRDRHIRRILRRELSRMKTDPGYRSDVDTLARLASEYMYFDLDPLNKQPDFFPLLWNIAPALSAYLATNYGAEREKGIRECSIKAADILGIGSLQGFSKTERQAWEWWSPLVVNLPNIKKWNTANRKALVKIIRAKGGVRESDYNRLYNQHPLLHKALISFAGRVDSD